MAEYHASTADSGQAALSKDQEPLKDELVKSTGTPDVQSTGQPSTSEEPKTESLGEVSGTGIAVPLTRFLRNNGKRPAASLLDDATPSHTTEALEESCRSHEAFTLSASGGSLAHILNDPHDVDLGASSSNRNRKTESQTPFPARKPGPPEKGADSGVMMPPTPRPQTSQPAQGVSPGPTPDTAAVLVAPNTPTGGDNSAVTATDDKENVPLSMRSYETGRPPSYNSQAPTADPCSNNCECSHCESVRDRGTIPYFQRQRHTPVQSWDGMPSEDTRKSKCARR